MVTMEAADLKPRFKSKLRRITVVPVTTVTKLTFNGFRHHALGSSTLTSHKYPPPSPPFAGVLYCFSESRSHTGFAPIPNSPFEALRLLIDTNLSDVGCPNHPGGDKFPLNPTGGRAGNFAATLSITMGLRDW